MTVGKQPRLPWLDAMKGFAILTVVLGHILHGSRASGLWAESDAQMRAVFNVIYAFHMPLFMTISGYVYRRAYVAPDGIPDRARVFRRVSDLAAVYVLFSLLFGGAKLLLSRYTNSDVTPLDLLCIPVKAIDLFWYLYVMLCLYLLFLLRPLHRANPVLLLVLFAALAVAVTASPIPRHTWLELTKNGYYLFFFYLGICLCAEKPPLLQNGWFVLAALIVSLGFIAAFFHHDRFIYVLPGVNLAAAFGLVLALWRLFSRCRPLGSSRLLRFLGGYSLEIYVLHCFLTAGLRALLPRLGLISLLPYILVCFVLSTALPIAAALILRRLGLHDLFFRPMRFVREHKTTP